MYKYYKEVNTVEHFCFASEICDSLGVYSNNNKPHVRFFTYFYDEYCKIVEINEDDHVELNNGKSGIVADITNNVYTIEVDEKFKTGNIDDDIMIVAANSIIGRK